MRILKLTAENFKRLRAIEIRPDGNVVEIRGKNGAGKQQPISEPVLTPEGWRPLGAIRAGDYNAEKDFVEFVACQIREQIDVLLSDYSSSEDWIVDDEFGTASEQQKVLSAIRMYVYNYLRETWLTDKPRANEERLHDVAKAAIIAVREWDKKHG